MYIEAKVKPKRKGIFIMCNNNYNGCNGTDNYDEGEFNNCNCHCNNHQNNCGCCNNDFGCGFGDIAFARAARINQRILNRRACEDRAAIQYLRNMSCCCRRGW